jgi:hypothetical protein
VLKVYQKVEVAREFEAPGIGRILEIKSDQCRVSFEKQLNKVFYDSGAMWFDINLVEPYYKFKKWDVVTYVRVPGVDLPAFDGKRGIIEEISSEYPLYPYRIEFISGDINHWFPEDCLEAVKLEVSKPKLIAFGNYPSSKPQMTNFKFNIGDYVKYIGVDLRYKNWKSKIIDRSTFDFGTLVDRYQVKFGKLAACWVEPENIEIVKDEPSKLTGNPFYSGKVNW